MKSGVSTLSRVLPAGVHLTFQQGESVHVEADETELQQVLFNLVLNACDAMPDGGDIEVTTGVAKLDVPLKTVGGSLAPGRWASLAVKDSGSGIDPAIRDHIFELFFTTKPIGQGTGLGLATVLPGSAMPVGASTAARTRTSSRARFARCTRRPRPGSR